MSNNLKYIDKNGIEFNEVRAPQILFKNGPLGIKDRIKHDGTEVTEIDNNDTSPLINAVDIDWNGIDVGDSESINTTGDLIAWIKKKGSGGSSGGTVLNKPLASVNNLLYGFPYEAGQVLTYNGSTYEWRKSSQQSTEKPINYLWAYTVAENDTQALNKLSRTSENNPPNSNYSITPINPPEGQYLYMTTARKRGEDYLPWDGRNVWSIPVRIGDNTTSGTGTDGDGYNYIYCLTDKNTTPRLSFGITVDKIESLSDNEGLDFNGSKSTNEINVWRDHPHGVREEYPQEWIAVAKSSGGMWSSYQGPVLWSHYGLDGKDGDTIEYIYKLTTSGVTEITDLTPPYYYEENGRIYSVNINEAKYQSDDFIPAGWSDNPQSLTTERTRQWVSTRKREWNSEQNKMVWGEFSTPTIWSENSVTIVDSPYVITNDNPAIQVICDYQGNSLEVNDTYEATTFTVTKGTTNVSDDFDWSYSVNYINENVNTPEIQVTGTFYNGTTDSQDYYQIIPSSIAVDKAVITVTATLKDGSFSLSTKVTAKKRKATSPGEIPQAYSLKLSQVVALRNSDGNIISSITIYAKDRQNQLITNIPGQGLTLKVGETQLQDNILTPEDLQNLFQGKNIGETITISLYYNNEEEDFGYITLINGDVEINVDGYTFALKKNNQTISYSKDSEGNDQFDPSYLEYPIIGYKNGEEINYSILSNLVSLGICTNCKAEIKTENDQVLLKITPMAIDSGGQVFISCRDEENNQICQILTAVYLLETADYQIRVIRGELTAKASSENLDALKEVVEKNTATITHNSRLLNSTIESQNVFSNLFGFSNNLNFNDSEPFIQGYGVEIKPRQSDRSYSSKITNIKLDTSKSAVVGMDIYRSYLSGDSTNSYKIGVHLNGREPSNVLINKESLDTNNNLINLDNYEFQYGLSYHVTLIYDYIEPDAENPLQYPSELSFNILGKSRLIVQNLKVEQGAVETKFCISDEDATVNNNVNLLPTVGLESDDKSICVRDHADNSDYNNQEASIDENGVITFTNTYVTEGQEWGVFMREDVINPLPIANDVYTLSFYAKASDTELHLMSRIYQPYNRGYLGDYTFYDYTKNIINDPLGVTVHKVGTQWKRYYARFYISPSASLYNNVFKVVIACINHNEDTPLLDFDNGTTGKVPRSFQIKDIVLQKGYTPSEDQLISNGMHVMSQINQTATEINLTVSDLKNGLKSTGIDIENGKISLKADNVITDGNFTANSLRTSDKGKGYTVISEGLFEVYNSIPPKEGQSVKPQVRFGMDGDGNLLLQYYDQEGNLLWELNPSGMVTYKMYSQDENVNTDYLAICQHYKESDQQVSGIWYSISSTYQGSWGISFDEYDTDGEDISNILNFGDIENGSTQSFLSYVLNLKKQNPNAQLSGITQLKVPCFYYKAKITNNVYEQGQYSNTSEDASYYNGRYIKYERSILKNNKLSGTQCGASFLVLDNISIIRSSLDFPQYNSTKNRYESFPTRFLDAQLQRKNAGDVDCFITEDDSIDSLYIDSAGNPDPVVEIHITGYNEGKQNPNSTGWFYMKLSDIDGYEDN